MLTSSRFTRTAFLVATLAAASPALTQPHPGWHTLDDDEGITLYYGVPATDYAPLSFFCAGSGTPLEFVYVPDPRPRPSPQPEEVRLQAGDIIVTILVTGTRLELDDTYLLRGETPLDDRLADLLTSSGVMQVFLRRNREEFPLDGARSAAQRFIEACRG